MNTKCFFRGLLSVILAGVLFALIPATSLAQETTKYQPYFGLLHAHTDISDGKGTVEDAFAQASQVEGLDFFAVTDHSNSFDNADLGTIGTEGTAISSKWAAGKAAAAAVTGESFVGIFGYEMTYRDSDGFGHINTFNTPGWQSRNQKEFHTLSAYYEALTAVPGSVSQFNHPGLSTGDFQNFSHRTESYDDAISLLEVGGEDGFTAYDQYIRALDTGWHVGPTNSQNNHHGSFGAENDVRTVLLAESLTEASLYEAMKNRRVYATEDKDLTIDYSLNGACLGSILPFQETLAVTAVLSDATDPAIGTLEVVTNSGKVIFSQDIITASETVTVSLAGKRGYYFLRVTQADGDIAVTAPVWVEEPAAPPTEPEESIPETSLPEESTPETTTPEETLPEESIPEESRPDMDKLGVRFCFGLLHAHTDFSDGKGTVEEAFTAASQAENMDFYGVTDHSNSFDNAGLGAINTDGSTVSAEWARGKAAAENAATEDFVGIFGYEMTWTDDRNIGHISTFGTPGWQSRNQEGFEKLTDYYETLTTVSGSVSQFNHPGPDLGEFENYTHYQAKYNAAISLLEIGDSKNFSAFDSYVKALDAGWHVAPTVSHNDHVGAFGSSGASRTAVLADTLTEDALYEAMSRRRVYATQDGDLCLYYTLDDCLMGSVVNSNAQHILKLYLYDPGDSGQAMAEIITDGGKVADSAPVPQSGALSLVVPGGGSYYFLRITQADGDIAVTAPVWTESYEDVVISAFVSDTEVPVPGQGINLTLSLLNEEFQDFILNTLTVSVDGKEAYRADNPGTVPAAQSLTLTVPYTQADAGIITLQATVEGTVGGVSRSLSEELTLRFRVKEMVTGILVDLGHSSHQPGEFDNLQILAEDANMTVSFFSGGLPDEGTVLILPPAEKPYETDFLQQVKIFCARGGELVICGTAGTYNARAYEYANQLLQTVGSTMRLQQDTVLDEIHNGGNPNQLYSTDFHTAAFWCEDISPGQYYAHIGGSAVAPGNGCWLVRGGKTAYSSRDKEPSPVLLAWEELSSGTHILAAGSLFLSDSVMPLPKNRWDSPTANQTIAEVLLGITRETFPVTDIADVRKGTPDTLYHIKGYTTSGTSNKYNRFPDTVYLQDETGGIAISPFREKDIPVGTAMVAAGYLKKQDENLVFMPVDYDFPDEGKYRFVPETLNHSQAMDYERYGGQLLQVEAKATAVTLTANGYGVQRITLNVASGKRAVVMIENNIFSGAYGTNTLASQIKIGRTVRAMGLLHLDSNGVPVLRVRNCEEVVWVPPFPRPGANPYTGDSIGLTVAACILSAAGLILVLKKRKK